MISAWNFFKAMPSPAITFFFGVLALVIGALFNSYLNRRRDDYLRQEEMKSVAAALYGEILLLRSHSALLGKIVAKAYFAEGTGFPSTLKFNETLLERNTLKDPILYKALASKLGLLPPDLILAVTSLHAEYQEMRDWFPMLIEKKERGFSYSVLTFLEPVNNVVLGIKPTLREFERLLQIKNPAEDPDMKDALAAIDIEKEKFSMQNIS